MTTAMRLPLIMGGALGRISQCSANTMIPESGSDGNGYATPKYCAKSFTIDNQQDEINNGRRSQNLLLPRRSQPTGLRLALAGLAPEKRLRSFSSGQMEFARDDSTRSTAV